MMASASVVYLDMFQSLMPEKERKQVHSRFDRLLGRSHLTMSVALYALSVILL
jgi:hypothetical protein